MVTVFIGTEAAEGMGHVAPWVAFVERALERGWQFHVAAPDVGQVQRLLGAHHALCVWQAPVFKADAHERQHSPKSWPELLVSLGYADGMLMTGALKAWINILKRVAPTVVFADYAPGLILAAHVLGVPCVEVGGGFCVPPLAPKPQPFPGVKANDDSVLETATHKLTTSFDSALRACGDDAGIANLSDMASWPFCRVVTSLPELDHYGVRSGVVYSGALNGRNLQAVPGDEAAVRPIWGNAAADSAERQQSIKVLGYLKPETPGLQILIDQLCAANVDACLVVPGTRYPIALSSATVKVVSDLVDLPTMLSLADVYISNGGLHGVGQALAAGCWPIVVPMQAEQVAMARNLVVHRWGSIWLPQGGHGDATGVGALLRRRASVVPIFEDKPSAEDFFIALVEQIVGVR